MPDLRREHGLQSGRATVFARERIDLNTGLLNRFRLRCEVQHALANSTGHVEAIYDVLIVVLALAIRAGINLLFRGIVVDS